MPKPLEITGQRFGRVVVLRRDGANRHHQTTWLVRCDCGVEFVALGQHLRSGQSASCGCSRATHGMRETPEYTIWRSMKARCTNPKHKSWAEYGGRGIRVCAAWLENFEAFVRDVGRRPGPGYSLDRKDNDGHYEPGNIRWATPRQQGRNRRSNDLLEVVGERLTLTEWAERTGIGRTTLRERLCLGWSPERTISTPARRYAR